jgi:hypothetical protein
MKKPQPRKIGACICTRAADPFPSKSAVSPNVKQVSWLAASAYSLHLPKTSGLSGHRRFRSAYSCGAATDLHRLPSSPQSWRRNLTSSMYSLVSLFYDRGSGKTSTVSVAARLARNLGSGKNGFPSPVGGASTKRVRVTAILIRLLYRPRCCGVDSRRGDGRFGA